MVKNKEKLYEKLPETPADASEKKEDKAPSENPSESKETPPA